MAREITQEDERDDGSESDLDDASRKLILETLGESVL